ncbi:hypothetical protein FS842_011164 [Serendipita sp. 407]|nr:hypothetical protein FS842_011164 [Serendipita sp. 407]
MPKTSIPNHLLHKARMVHPLSYESAATLISLSIGLAILFKLSSRGKSKPKQRKDHGFIELSAGQDPTIDIIAIHGLDGHREQSWTAENEKLWLKDFLPNDLPNARILSYGYDADTRSFIQTSSKTISHHAEDFVERLSQLRRMHPRRPIIFLAHSLGGIILKRYFATAIISKQIEHFEISQPRLSRCYSLELRILVRTVYSLPNGWVDCFQCLCTPTPEFSRISIETLPNSRISSAIISQLLGN